MPKYIDADRFERILMALGEDVLCDDCCIEVLNRLDNAPAADVAPVRHGHWVYKMREHIRYEDVTGTNPLGETHTVTVKTHVRGPVPYCSLCDALAADSFLDYCPRCGAKMDGEANDGEQQ
jgi:hypothetical protein